MPRHSVYVISLRRKQKVLFVDEVHEDAPIEEVKEASTGFSVQTKWDNVRSLLNFWDESFFKTKHDPLVVPSV